MKRLLFVLFAGLVLAGCATHGEDPLAPKTAHSVNLKRYQGTWYELARLPMYFQRNCAQSEAHYSLRPDGNVDVLNRCLTADWQWEE
ncbi:lipocalin family protein, partial [Pseudomonas sp. MD195_PC81_125]